MREEGECGRGLEAMGGEEEEDEGSVVDGGVFLFTERVYIEMGDNLGKGKSPFFKFVLVFLFYQQREERGT